MIPELKKTPESKMQKSVEALKTDLAKVRTGRAHTGLLDHVMVDYYGSMVPVNQVANITLIDARTIGVQTWEKPMLGKVERRSATATSVSTRRTWASCCACRCRR
jgi:ribosome recycling factor